jgi:hypothetical protein
MANILKVLKGPLSTLGKKNRNGRIYSRALWEKVLNSEYWKDMISNNTLCGEIVHPGERTESDSWEIDARNISHRIKEAHIEGDKLMGTVEVLDTEQGRNLAELINAGCTVGISARGMGDLNGDEVDPDTYNFKCFDITMRPSDPNARLIPITESENIRLIISESEESDRLIKGSDEPGYEDPTDSSKYIRSDIFVILENKMKGLMTPEMKDKFEIERGLHNIKVSSGDQFLGALDLFTPRETNNDKLFFIMIGSDERVTFTVDRDINKLKEELQPDGRLSKILKEFLDVCYTNYERGLK